MQCHRLHGGNDVSTSGRCVGNAHSCASHVALGQGRLRRRVVNHGATRAHILCKADRSGLGSEGIKFDVVLSSGFLAFAHHSGFLQAVEEEGIRVAGVMGTSAGALAGSLYCAGYTPQQVAVELSRDPPIALLRASAAPWRGGLITLDGVVERLRQLLPPRFEDLDRDFAVGVVTADGEYQLIDSGPLPEAVAASAAIPFMFEPVDIPGRGVHSPYKDGGIVDRVGLRAWRNRRRAQAHALGHSTARIPPALVHVITRSSPFSGADDVSAMGEAAVAVVHSPRSGANFMSLGDFSGVMAASTHRARPVVVQAAASLRSALAMPTSSSTAAAPAAALATAAISSAASSAVRAAAAHRSPERKRYVRTSSERQAQQQ